MIPIVLETATPQELEELPNVGRKRTQAILALRDEEAITMQRLVAVTNITQVEWARMYRDGLFTSNIPAEELVIPTIKRAYSSEGGNGGNGEKINGSGEGKAERG